MTDNKHMLTKVQEWLDARGFTLEMRTASAFRAAGFEVRQASTYTDSVTGKDREIDVLAIDPDYIGVVQIQFVLECKRTKKPWVLLCSPNTLRNYNRTFAFAPMTTQVRDVLFDDHFEDVMLWPWMRKEGLVGYSVREAFSDDADLPFAAASSVASASDSFVQEQTQSSKGYAAPFRIASPIIVVDGPLVRGSLSEKGDVDLEEVEEGEFLFFFRDRGSCIRILTASRVAEFAQEAKRVASEIRSMLKSEEQKVVDSWKKLKH
jgi:hypothetical protein